MRALTGQGEHRGTRGEGPDPDSVQAGGCEGFLKMSRCARRLGCRALGKWKLCVVMDMAGRV